MKIIGLTGGIASGKNFVAEIFQKAGAVVFDADAEVHRLLDTDESVIAEVRNFFPEAIIDEKVQRKLLGKIVFADDKKLKDLESILHPRLRHIYEKFLHDAQKSNAKFVVLNIPLLLESEAYECDYVIAIIPSDKVRLERFIKREKEKHPNMTDAELISKFENVKAKQLQDEERKKYADFIVKNDGSAVQTEAEVVQIISSLNLV